MTMEYGVLGVMTSVGWNLTWDYTAEVVIAAFVTA